jgi:shikimate kinase
MQPDANPPRTVYLVGLMGAGKSRVARELGKVLHCAVYDSDAEIERAAGMTVAEIFAREGDASFRARERAVIEALAQRGGVVALGGGAMVQPGAPERLRAQGMVVYLRARAETLARRVGTGRSRPLLAGLDGAARLAKLRALLAQREPAYRQAHYAIDVDTGSPRRIAREIAERLGAAPR